MPRRPYVPTDQNRRQVEALAAYGIPQEDIARVVGISLKTLHKYFRDELDTGSTKATAKVAESLFKKATGEGSQAVTAAIFWLKTRAGWKEKSAVEHSGLDGGPIELVSRIDWHVVDHDRPSD